MGSIGIEAGNCGGLFAADYPFESMKEAVQFMDNAPISDNEREKIYHLNTEKLLTLSH